MSQNVNNCEKILQGGYEWELSSLERSSKIRHPALANLPANLFPILVKDVQYTVKVKGVWKSPEHTQSSEILLRPPDMFLKAHHESGVDTLTFRNGYFFSDMRKTMIKGTLRSTTGSQAAQWDLFVDNQLVLQNIRSLPNSSRLIQRIWKAALGQRLNKFSTELSFSPALERECRGNTPLWKRLLIAIIQWSEFGISELAQSIRRSELAQSTLHNLHRAILRTFPLTPNISRPPVTNEPQNILQATSQPNAANRSQALSNPHKMVSAQSTPALELVYATTTPPSTYDTSTDTRSTPSSNGKRKRASSTTSSIHKRQRTTNPLFPALPAPSLVHSNTLPHSQPNALSLLHPSTETLPVKPPNRSTNTQPAAVRQTDQSAAPTSPSISTTPPASNILTLSTRRSDPEILALFQALIARRW